MLRLATDELRHRFDFEINDYLSRAREFLPADVTAGCWRKSRRTALSFLPASALMESHAVAAYHLLRRDARPEPVPFTNSPIRAVMVDAHNLVQYSLVRGHGGMADAFLLFRNAIILVRLDRGARQRCGTILPHPDLTAHDLLELVADIEREFPRRFEIER